MQKSIILQLPAPHPGQFRLIQEAKRFNVVCCGRRWGKTVLGMDRLIRPALEGKAVAWFAPNFRLSTEVWRELQKILRPALASSNQQDKRLELYTGGSIEMWSLDTPDSGRGRAYACVVVDEAAMVPNLDQAWQSIRPMLTDLRGEAWFLSTPKGMNYFKTLFDYGSDTPRRDWASWQMATSENPYIDRAEIEAASLDMTESAFNQEYLALFVNWEGSVFRGVSEAATATVRPFREAGHHYVVGCDWGRSKDYTVLLVLDTTARAVVALDRSHRVDYALQCERLKALCETWQPQQIIAEQNSIGQPVIEQLTRDGLPIQPFTTTNASKTQAIEALALAFERSDIRIPNDPVLVSELVAFQAERLPSGLLRYGAPGAQHDDTVMALAMAWTAVSAQFRRIYPMPDSDLGQGIQHPRPLAARLWAGHPLEHCRSNLGSARSRVGCAISVRRIFGGSRPSYPCGGGTLSRGLDSRPDRSDGKQQKRSGWATADSDVLQTWTPAVGHPQSHRVGSLEYVPTNAIRASQGVRLALKIPGRASALPARRTRSDCEGARPPPGRRPVLVSGLARMLTKPVQHPPTPPNLYPGSMGWAR
jgi:hypothetical protein